MNETFGKALVSHYKTLRRFGKEALDEQKNNQNGLGGKVKKEKKQVATVTV